MGQGTGVRLALIMLACVVIVPAAAYAQASITGLVRDTSGAVLPGVTVEAASPALIEQVRVAVTDGTGRYAIADLRPGAYSVTFTLPGFATFLRDGIQLSGTAVATVDGNLSVGALEETVTVTGEAPTVDVQSTVRQRVMNQDVLDVLPSNRGPGSAASLMPGVTRALSQHDVGGIQGDHSRAGGLLSRGVSDARIFISGVPTTTGIGAPHSAYNLAAYQEVVVDAGGFSTEHREGGVRISLIPRDGGNTFSGSFYTAFANGSMQGDNFSQDLQDRGLGTPNSIKKLLDLNPAFGGPIVQDRVWFHATARYSNAWNFATVFFNKNAGNPDVWTYEPDTSRGPAADEVTIEHGNGRVTWQATPRNKLAVTYDISDVCSCPNGLTGTLAPEASQWVNYRPAKKQLSGQWTIPFSNRLLLETTIYRHWASFARQDENPYFQSGSVKLIAVREQSNNMRYRGVAAVTDFFAKTFYTRAILSYITGAHALKVGFVGASARSERFERNVDANVEFRFRNGVPNQLTLVARPQVGVANMDADHGLFVEDRWTLNRLTLTGGLRYDYFKLSFPDQRIGPTEFTPDRNVVIPKADGPRWHDISPRGSLALDVFGDGKTALKANLGRYMGGEAVSGTLFANAAPTNRLVTRTSRSWSDANRDFVPDCDQLNPAANGECGRWSNANFGSTIPAVEFDPDVLSGQGKRRYNWQFSAGVQRELIPQVSLDVSYWRTSFGNFIVTQNRAYGPADFDEFSITAPVDPGLPGGGGHVVPGLFDLKPEAFGRAYDGLVTFADNFGKQTEVWNGVDVTVNARPRPGVLLQGGTTTERQTTDNCEVVRLAAGEPPSRGTRLPAYNPGQLHCDVKGTFLTRLKLLGSFTVPRIGVQVTGSLQNLPGPEIAADYTASNAEIRPSLGRNLAGRARNRTVNIIEPRTLYGERVTQLDLRIGKLLRFGPIRATTSLDLYNVFNSSAVLVQNNRFATWQRPQRILNARYAQVVVQLNY